VNLSHLVGHIPPLYLTMHDPMNIKFKSTLLEQQCPFSAVTRLPVEKSSLRFISRTLLTFVTNSVGLVSIGHNLIGVHNLPIFSVTTNTHFANRSITW
jgi:hypothetical protein